MSTKEGAFLHFDVLKLVVRRVSHTAITVSNIRVVAVGGHGNLQH
jgi:hypothetical protein